MSGFDAIATFLLTAWDFLLTGQVSLALQVTLAMIFIVSGTHKVRNPAAAASSAAYFGLPIWPTKTAGLTIAAAELLVAASLFVLVRPVALVALVASVLLSLAFSVLTGRAMLRGESFDCNCLGNERVSWGSVIRSTAMLVAALVAGASLVWGGARGVGVATVSIAAGTALALICLPYLARLIARFRFLRHEFDKRVDWLWLVDQHSVQREA